MEIKLLAGRLVEFYKEYDFYDFMDKLDGTEEDAVIDLAKQLEDPDAVKGILDALVEFAEIGELSTAEKAVLVKLVLDLSTVHEGFGKGIDDVVAEAMQRSDDSTSEKITIDILQLKHGDEMHGMRYAHLDWLDDGVNSVHCRNYDHIYRYSDEEPVDLGQKDAVMDLLEKVYTRFNIRHPEDFRGHSLSTSDVVILSKDNNKMKAFYCDWIGFKELPGQFVADFKKEHLVEQERGL